MRQAAIPAFILSGVTIICATVLQALGHASVELWTVAFTLSGGAVGITIPSISSAASSASTTAGATSVSAASPSASTVARPAVSSASLAAGTPALTQVGGAT